MNKNFQKFVKFTPVLARFMTYLLLFLIPLVFFKNWMFPFVSSKLPLFYIFSALAFCSLVLNLIFRSENRATKKQLLPILPIALLITSLGISGFLAPLRDTAFWSTLDRGDSWFFLFHLFLLILTVFILILKDRGGTYKRNLLLATLSAAGIIALSVWLGNEGFNAGGKILSQSRGGGLLGNSSFAATYLLFAVFLGLMIIFSRETFSKGMRRFALAITILIVTSPVFVNFGLWSLAISFKSIFSAPQLLLGSGRGAAVGIILGIIVALAFKLIYAQKKLWKIVGIGIIVASVLGYIFFFVSIQRAGTPLQAVFEEQAGSNRLIFWDIARDAITDKPILGWGLENFRVPFHRNFNPALLRDTNSSEPWTDRAHNIFYDMTVTGGYVGLILFLIVIGSLIWGIYYAGVKKLLSTWSAAFLLGAMYAYLFQGLFVFDTIFSYLMLGLLYAFVFGLLQRENNSSPTTEVSAHNITFKVVSVSIMALGLVASIIFIVLPLARSASLFGKIVATPLLERTALWSHIGDDGAILGQGANLARLALYSEIEYGKKRNEIFSPGQEEVRGALAEEFQIIASVLDKSVLFQRAHNRGVVMYMTLNTAARIYNSSILLSGKKDEKQLVQAEYYGREAIKESPTNPQGYWILAQTLILQNKISEADAMLEYAINIDPYNKQSHRLSIQTANGVGDKKMATLRTERARTYIPDFVLP